MDDDELRAQALRHTPDALKVLASIVGDPTAGPKARRQARKELELRLKQIGDDISPDLRREIENALHDK
jgi:hypothetical protein